MDNQYVFPYKNETINKLKKNPELIPRKNRLVQT